MKTFHSFTSRLAASKWNCSTGTLTIKQVLTEVQVLTPELLNAHRAWTSELHHQLFFEFLSFLLASLCFLRYSCGHNRTVNLQKSPTLFEFSDYYVLLSWTETDPYISERASPLLPLLRLLLQVGGAAEESGTFCLRKEEDDAKLTVDRREFMRDRGSTCQSAVLLDEEEHLALQRRRFPANHRDEQGISHGRTLTLTQQKTSETNLTGSHKKVWLTSALW